MPTPGRDLCAPLPPPRRLRPVPGVPGALATVLAGEEVVLLAERALYWPRGATLLVADVHLGKAASLRAGGVPVPRGATATDLDRLDALVQRTGSRRLVVLGDFIHAATGRVPALDAAVTAWRARHPDLALELVRGNHDGTPATRRPRGGSTSSPRPTPCRRTVRAAPRASDSAHRLRAVRPRASRRPADRSRRRQRRLPCFVLGLRQRAAAGVRAPDRARPGLAARRRDRGRGRRDDAARAAPGGGAKTGAPRTRGRCAGSPSSR